MTRREFLEAICNENISVELKDFAKAEIEKLDTRNEKRATANSSKKAEENKPIIEAILKTLEQGGGMTTADLIEILPMTITQSKAGALCRQLRDKGILIESEIKVPKKGKRKFYELQTA